MVGRQSLADELYSILFEQIAAAELRSGDQLVTMRIAEELGVSETPVREALQRLTANGLVESQHNHGFQVARPGPEELHDIFLMRAALEGVAARLMAERGTASAIAALHRTADDLMRARSEGDFIQYCLRDIAFHSQIARASRHPQLADSTGLEALILLCFMERRPYRDDGMEAPWYPGAMDTHHDIVAAIEARDPDGSEEIMRMHIRTAATRTLAWLARGRAEAPDDGEGASLRESRAR